MKLIMTLPLVALQVAADTFSGDFLSFKLYNRCGTSPDRKKAFEDNFPTHGCWCPSLSTDTIAHKGRPLTDLDRLCLERSKCLRCNKGCPDDGYDADLDTDCSNASCAASNTDCQKAACECDLKFLQQVEAFFAANGEELDATKDSVSADQCVRSSLSFAGTRPSTNCPTVEDDSRTCGPLSNFIAGVPVVTGTKYGLSSSPLYSGDPLTMYDGVEHKDAKEFNLEQRPGSVEFSVTEGTHFNVVGIKKTQPTDWGTGRPNYSNYYVYARILTSDGATDWIACTPRASFIATEAEQYYNNNETMKWDCTTAGKDTTGFKIESPATDYLAIGEVKLEEDCEKAA